MHTIDLLGGAFVSTFEKGEKGKPGRWVTSPTFKKPADKEKPMREPVQYAVLEKIEGAAMKRNQDLLRKETLELVSFLKSIADAK